MNNILNLKSALFLLFAVIIATAVLFVVVPQITNGTFFSTAVAEACCGDGDDAGGPGDGGGFTPAQPPTCSLATSPNSVTSGQSATITWYITANAGSAQLTIDNGVGNVGSGVNVSGTHTVTPTQTTTYTGTVSGPSGTGTCTTTVAVNTPSPTTPPAPTCELWANGPTVTRGQSTMLGWEHWNQYTNFVIDSDRQGRINSNPSDSPNHMMVSPTQTTTYTGTISGPGGTNTCTQTITVNEPPAADPAPTCTLSFSDTEVIRGTENFTYTWSTTNATSFSTDREGAKSLNGSKTTVSNGLGTYVFNGTATGPGGTAHCQATITVVEAPTATPAPTCTLSFSDSVVERGTENFTYTWSTTNATSFSTDREGAKSLNGSRTGVSNGLGTYVFNGTATGPGGTAHCQATITVVEDDDDVTTSRAPRCEFFRASDSDVRSGERVTLLWETTRGSELEIRDNRGNQIFSTRNRRTIDEGEVIVRPTRDTRYTLTVERGSEEDTCTLRTNVEGQNVTFISDRDQLPLTSIALTQVPYTGFDAGPVLTAFFYGLIFLWSAALAYVFGVKKGHIFGLALLGNRGTAPEAAQKTDVFAAAPTNLPTGTFEQADTSDSPVASYIEERAHRQNVLLSSDAIRLIIDQADSDDEEIALLDAIIERAREAYPQEDGWIVVNRARIAELFADKA